MDPDVAITLRECISGGVLMFAVAITGSLSMLREIIEIPSGISLLSGAGIIAGFSYLMWYAANKRIGCARGMAANSTYVIWGVLINALFWGEPVSAQTLAGCVCVLAGVILVSLTGGEVDNV
ncbi:EamA-like transporter family [Bacteroides xylanisolvens]|nr:EamA-like transporter family [Bacteroides xylanisolvens]